MTTTITSGFTQVIPRRVSFKQTAHDSIVMAYRGLIKIRRSPEQLFDVTLQPILFTLMFTFIFGGAIAGDTQSYLPLFIPGILVQTVLTGASSAGTQLREDMDKGIFDRFKSLPIARIAPLAGALLADTVRYVIAATITFGVGYAIGYRPAGGIPGVLGTVLLVSACAWALSWIFALIGVTGKSATGVQGISLMILFPLTFMSNAFVPTDTLPGWLQAFVKVNPVSHVVTAARELANTGQFGTEGVVAVLSAAVVVAIFAPLTVRKYQKHVS